VGGGRTAIGKLSGCFAKTVDSLKNFVPPMKKGSRRPTRYFSQDIQNNLQVNVEGDLPPTAGELKK
jgi:hypothetical protein